MSSEGERMDDTIKILIATDIHLGYEHNRRRGGELNDSFTTFEEILTYAKDYEADFILLGGDLFHDTKPSQPVVMKCMDLLRKYCLGNRDNKIQFLSDPDVVFRHCAYKTVNFEDPNFNISIPVFSIHGNHDDPSFGAVGSMDVLSVSGLVNYFGKWTDLTKITIPPLILKKGETHVSLYGLSYINDQRLSRLFRDGKVDMLRPEEIPDSFNIFVLHQNRAKHEYNAYIPEHNLPGFLNLVIWGHEHECRITPEFIPGTEYFISQPGSSVATSLCEGESKQKYVGLLSVYKNKFKMKKLKLKTVRPFVFDNLILREENIPQVHSQPMFKAVFKFVDNHIENVLMRRAAEQLSGHPQQPLQPFLRLRIFYSRDDEQFDVNLLCQKYINEVANPTDIVIFRKEKHAKDGSKLDLREMDFTDMEYLFNEDVDWSKSVQQELKKYFEADENKDALSVLTINGLNEALTRYVTREDGDAFKDVLTHQMKKTIKQLETKDVDTEEAITEEIKKYREERREKGNEEQEELSELFKDTTRKSGKPQDDNISLSLSDEDEEQRDESISKGRGKAASRGTRSRGRGSRGGRGRAKTNDTNTLDVTKASAFRTTKSNPKKQDHSTLQNFVTTSQRAARVQFLPDSD